MGINEYDIGDCFDEAGPCPGIPVQPFTVTGHNGRVADLEKAKRMSSAPFNLQRQLQCWTLLATMVLCLGQTIAAAHLHFDAQKEEACTLCAIPESGRVPEVGWVDTEPPVGCRAQAVPVFSTTLAPRPYEARPSRAPPVS